MEREWLKESLLCGHGSNALKLGTVLTCGWFWTRVGGCCLLYRGERLDSIDFSNILAAASYDANQISPSSSLKHEAGASYFYLVRRTNGCGQQEKTLSAVVKVSFDSDGYLTPAGPNRVFDGTAEVVEENKIRLVWFYCPAGQRSAPTCFSIYCDNGTGEIDYEHPAGTIAYHGASFYSYQSEALAAGTYLFVIRTEAVKGVQGISAKKITAQLTDGVIDPIAILSVEVV